MKNSCQSKTKRLNDKRIILTERLDDKRTIMIEEDSLFIIIKVSLSLFLYKILTTLFGNSQSSKSQEQTLNCVLDFPVVVSFLWVCSENFIFKKE